MIGSLVNNVPLAIVLAILSHYLLDLFPHIDYPLTAEERKNKRKILFGFLKLAIDFLSGILIIMLFSSGRPIVYVCALAAIMPDLLTAFRYTVPNKFFEKHYQFHSKIIHTLFLKDKKISNFWKVFAQVVVIAVSTALMTKGIH